MLLGGTSITQAHLHRLDVRTFDQAGDVRFSDAWRKFGDLSHVMLHECRAVFTICVRPTRDVIRNVTSRHCSTTGSDGDEGVRMLASVMVEQGSQLNWVATAWARM